MGLVRQESCSLRITSSPLTTTSCLCTRIGTINTKEEQECFPVPGEPRKKRSGSPIRTHRV